MGLHSVKTFGKFAASLPAATIHEQWEAVVAKVGGKIFALIGETGTPIVFKVSEISFDGLTELKGIGQAAYFAKRAWVSVDKGTELSDDDLKAYIAESHRLVSGKLTRKQKAGLGLPI